MPTAAIAQLGERQTEDLEVPGSIPGLGILLRVFSDATNLAEGRYTWLSKGIGRPNGVTVSTLDFESSDGGSNPP
jgi:hypothetical protein